MRSAVNATHRLGSSPETVHWGFLDASLKPVLHVNPGDTVIIDCVSGLIGHGPDPSRHSTPPELDEILTKVPKGSGNHILTGPIYIRDAAPGDVLEVKIREINLRQDWGWNIFRGYFGTLPEDFPYKRFSIIDLDVEKNIAVLPSGLRVPLAPFFGQLAVAPPAAFGRQNSKEPRDFGGNIDCKELTGGSTIYLPVWNEGALFSTGDGHAAQGDGEVDGTAIETALSGTFEFRLHKGLNWKMPRAETATHVITFGFAPSLDVAAKQALRTMIAWICELKGLLDADAYALCSFACDLHVTQTVNINNGIHAMIDKRILGLDGITVPI
ncbi:MAG: acetamidase/formamidase family protein [Methylovirgula sp.]